MKFLIVGVCLMAWIQDWTGTGELRSMYPYIAELHEGIIERMNLIPGAISGADPILQSPVPLDRLTNVFAFADAFQKAMDDNFVSTLANPNVLNDSATSVPNSQFMNHLDQGGSFDNQSAYPKIWDEATLLVEIGDPTRLRVNELDELDFAWARQQFDFLNLQRWMIDADTWTADVADGDNEKTGGSQNNVHATSLAAKNEAISIWNTSPITGFNNFSTLSFPIGRNNVGKSNDNTFNANLFKLQKQNVTTLQNNSLTRDIDFYSHIVKLPTLGITFSNIFDDFGNGFTVDNFNKFDALTAQTTVSVKSIRIGTEVIPTPFNPNDPGVNQQSVRGWRVFIPSFKNFGALSTNFIIHKFDVTGGFDKIQ